MLYSLWTNNHITTITMLLIQLLSTQQQSIPGDNHMTKTWLNNAANNKMHVKIITTTNTTHYTPSQQRHVTNKQAATSAQRRPPRRSTASWTAICSSRSGPSSRTAWTTSISTAATWAWSERGEARQSVDRCGLSKPGIPKLFWARGPYKNDLTSDL